MLLIFVQQCAHLLGGFGVYNADTVIGKPTVDLFFVAGGVVIADVKRRVNDNIVGKCLPAL